MKKLIAGVAAALSVMSGADAAVLTFDDTPTLALGYAGFSWVQFGVLAPQSTPLFANSGYNAGRISGAQVGYGAPGTDPAIMSSASSFTLNSLNLTAAWHDNYILRIAGYAGAAKSYEATVALSAVTPVFRSLNWTGLDRVEFDYVAVGTQHPGYQGSGGQFVVDDITINEAVPEPASWAMFIGGFGLVGAALRTRMRATAAA